MGKNTEKSKWKRKYRVGEGSRENVRVGGGGGMGKLSWYAVNMTSCSCSCWRQKGTATANETATESEKLWLRLSLGQDSLVMDTYWTLAWVCGCGCGCVCFSAVCHFGNCTDCTTVTERAASVCFNFSYRQAAASAASTRLHLIQSLLLPLRLLPSAIQF